MSFMPQSSLLMAVLASLPPASLALASPAQAQEACTALAILAPETLGENVSVQAAQALPSLAKAFPGLKGAAASGPLCRVEGRITGENGSNIAFELWLPDDRRWNRKLQSVGNGGYRGALNPKAMVAGLTRHYATLTTDMGHRNDPPENSSDANWAIGHPQRVVDYAYRAEHLATQAARRLIEAYYGIGPDHAFYTGCSAGGILGLNELLRYPGDYDGYLVGAATPDHLGQEVGAFWNTLAASLADPANAIRPVQAEALHAAVLKQCAGRDGGAPGDRFLTDPTMCRFDPAVLLCRKGSDADSCLAPGQLELVRKIYDGPRDPRNGQSLYAGLTPGTELGWERYFLGRTNPVGTDRPWAGFFALMVHGDPAWLEEKRYLDFDFGTDLDHVRGKIVGSEPLETSWRVASRDVEVFRQAGGKVIQYHGWDDPNIPALEALRFRHALIVERIRTHREDLSAATHAIDDMHRLFMVPGMAHCSAGEGLDDFGQRVKPVAGPPQTDALTALEQWVERGIAPDRFIASRDAEESGTGAISRPVCAWPARAVYDGRGDPAAAASFSCQLPEAMR